MSNNAEKSLLSIQEQINKFDNKANSLITIVGIVFALSLGILDTFNQFVGIELTEELQYKFRLLILLSTLYFISFTVELVFLILVVYLPLLNEREQLSPGAYFAPAERQNKNSEAKLYENQSFQFHRVQSVLSL